MKPRKRNSTPISSVIVYNLLTSPNESEYCLTHIFNSCDVFVAVNDSFGNTLSLPMVVTPSYVRLQYTSNTSDNLTVHIRG